MYILKIADYLRTLYYFVFRPHTSGVKCLVESHGEFLLVRISYGHKCWTVPGGGIKRGESPERAAARELKEEAGVAANNIQSIGSFLNTREYKKDTVYVYLAQADSRKFEVDGFEVLEAGWFKRDELPQNRSYTVDIIFDLYDKARNIQ